MLKEIGSGTFGKAFMCRSKDTAKLYVIKRIPTADMAEGTRREVRNESQILQALNHPNIIKFVRAYRDRNENWNIVMEYAPEGSLYDLIEERKA